MQRISAGPPSAPNACGTIVENSAASPACDQDGALAQSQHHRAGQHGEPVAARVHPELGGDLPGERIFATVLPAASRDSSQVVTPRLLVPVRADHHVLVATDSTSWSSVVPRARAIGASWSRAIRR